MWRNNILHGLARLPLLLVTDNRKWKLKVAFKTSEQRADASPVLDFLFFLYSQRSLEESWFYSKMKVDFFSFLYKRETFLLWRLNTDML